MSRLRRDEQGFTLVELLVTLLVGMVIMAGVLGLLDMTLRGSASTIGRTQAVREGRGAIDRVGQELRLASCPSTGPAVLSATDTSVSYYVSRPLTNWAATLHKDWEEKEAAKKAKAATAPVTETLPALVAAVPL